MSRTGKTIIKYIREQASALGIPEIEVYSAARIKSVTIDSWDKGKTKPQKYSIFRLEHALQLKARALGKKRVLNQAIFGC